MPNALQRLAAASAKTRKNLHQPMPSVPKPQPMRTPETVMVDSEDFYETTSYRAQIENLTPGQSFARAKRVDGDELTKELLEHHTRNLRMATQPTVYRIAKRTGAEFTIEQGDFRTQSKDYCVVLVVTRIA